MTFRRQQMARGTQNMSSEVCLKELDIFSLEKRRLNRDLPREHCLYLKWVLKEMDSVTLHSFLEVAWG